MVRGLAIDTAAADRKRRSSLGTTGLAAPARVWFEPPGRVRCAAGSRGRRAARIRPVAAQPDPAGKDPGSGTRAARSGALFPRTPEVFLRHDLAVFRALTDADAERLLADLDSSEAGTSTLEPSLSYRGFSLSRSEGGSDERSAGGDSDVASQAFEIFPSEAPEIEERLFATGRDVIDDEVTKHVRERLQLGLPKAERASQAVPVACPPCKGLAAPNGWYLALAIRPNRDCHWYRQDSNGCWSHEPGQVPLTDLDNAGKRVRDPRLAGRGPCQTLCGYTSTDRIARIG